MNEGIREELYMANMAQASFQTLQYSCYFGFQLFCYNFSHKALFSKLLSQVKDFEPTEQFFDSTKSLF